MFRVAVTIYGLHFTVGVCCSCLRIMVTVRVYVLQLEFFAVYGKGVWLRKGFTDRFYRYGLRLGSMFTVRVDG